MLKTLLSSAAAVVFELSLSLLPKPLFESNKLLKAVSVLLFIQTNPPLSAKLTPLLIVCVVP